MIFNNRHTLVRGDNNPGLYLMLTRNDNGAPLDVSPSDHSARFYFREEGNEDENVFIVECTKVFPALGIMKMLWPIGGLAIDPGDYEAVVTVTQGTRTITTPEPIKFRVTGGFSATAALVNTPRVRIINGQTYIRNEDDATLWHLMTVTGPYDAPTINLGDGAPLPDM